MITAWRTREELAHQITLLAKQGATRRAIARALGVSRNTVRKLLDAHAAGREDVAQMSVIALFDGTASTFFDGSDSRSRPRLRRSGKRRSSGSGVGPEATSGTSTAARGAVRTWRSVRSGVRFRFPFPVTPTKCGQRKRNQLTIG